MITRARSFWRDTAPSAKWLAYICLPIGVALTSIGLYGDAHDWWQNRGFLTNLLSSLTSLLFGAPTALIILGKFTTDQAEVRRRREIRTQSQHAANTFRSTILSGFSSDNTDVLLEHMREFKQRNTEYLRALALLDGEEESKRQVLQAHERREEQINCFLSSRYEERRNWHYNIRTQWRLLSTDVRPRVESAGLRWLPARSYVKLDSAAGDLAQLRGTPFMRRDRRLRMMLESEGNPEETRQLLLTEAESASRWISGMTVFLELLVDIEHIAT
ncbi:hypothetical protein [Streptomyces massasporeus]|uniref:hypothetical protein n=1 Tax=Streptomyces massasporeus TaxID=67324 RepID=UPI0036AD9696